MIDLLIQNKLLIMYMLFFVVGIPLANYVTENRKKLPIIYFMLWLLLLSFITGIFAYNYHGSELQEYREALAGKHKLYPPSEEEMEEFWRKEDERDLEKEITRSKLVLEELRKGKTKEEAENFIDEQDSINDIEKDIDAFNERFDALGSNPPKEEIERMIERFEYERYVRTAIAITLTTICYSVVYIFINHRTKDQ